MNDLREYTAGLRRLADVIDRAAATEPSMVFYAGASLSFTVAEERVDHARAELGDGQPWEPTRIVPGFTRDAGPHLLHLFIADKWDEPRLALAPTVAPSFSPLRVVPHDPKDAA